MMISDRPPNSRRYSKCRRTMAAARTRNCHDRIERCDYRSPDGRALMALSTSQVEFILVHLGFSVFLFVDVQLCEKSWSRSIAPHYRYSAATFWPSTYPVSFRPWRNGTVLFS